MSKVISIPVDLRDGFESVITIGRTARTATSGWRAICVRERRRLGAELATALASLDLDEEATRAGVAVRGLVRRAAHDVDTLVFGLFDTIDDGTAVYAGYHVSGVASRGRSVVEFSRDPWAAERLSLRSDALDAILRAAPRARRDRRPVVEHLLLFGALLLTSRFAALRLPHRVVVGFDADREVPAELGAPPFVELVP